MLFGRASSLTDAPLEGENISRGGIRCRPGMGECLDLFEDFALVTDDYLDGKMNAALELARKRIDAKQNDNRRPEQQPDEPIPHPPAPLSVHCELLLHPGWNVVPAFLGEQSKRRASEIEAWLINLLGSRFNNDIAFGVKKTDTTSFPGSPLVAPGAAIINRIREALMSMYRAFARDLMAKSSHAIRRCLGIASMLGGSPKNGGIRWAPGA
jgi:hypothetical protein